MQEIVLARKESYRQVLENTKEIHNAITSLNQQSREYYSLCFAEVQKELSEIKVKLGKIEWREKYNKKGQVIKKVIFLNIAFFCS